MLDLLLPGAAVVAEPKWRGVLKPMKSKRRFLGPGALLSATLASGCVWFADPSPEIVRVTLDGDADSFILVTSTEFIATNNESGNMTAQLFEADTTLITLPFDRSWNIEAEQRFFLLAAPVDSSAVQVQVRVFLDGDKDFDRNVDAVTEDPVRYIYLFNQQILQDFELL